MSRNVLIKNLFIIVLISFVFIQSLSVVVHATEVEEKGYVEYHTVASINFTEIIEVTLTDKDMGYYYTHTLYRVNDYGANLSIPLGTYSISAKVITETESDLSQYVITYPTDEIVINNTQSAVPINLAVEIVTNVEVFPKDYPENTDDYSSSSENSSEQTSQIEESEPIEETIANDTGAETNEKKDNSLLVSTLFYAGLILVVLGIYLLYKYKFNKN